MAKDRRDNPDNRDCKKSFGMKQNKNKLGYDNTPFERYRYPLRYSENTGGVEEIINLGLEQAWLNAPSKNNFMPYRVHLLKGNKEINKKIYYTCLQQQSRANGHEVAYENLKNYEKSVYPPNFKNILSAPYFLFFTHRVAKENLNETQENLLSQGYNYEQTATEGPLKQSAIELAHLEIGIFSTIFASICLKYGIDVSHTRCIPPSLDYWHKEYFSFLDSVPMLLMTAGKGIKYRRDRIGKNRDLKPNFEMIVQNQ